MEEVWKDVDGFEGRYQVSNLGNVKSLNYRNCGYSKNMTPKINKDGRLWVELSNGMTKRQFLIHRLVAMAFIPNPNKFAEINHKDENPKNNRVENLEWCTRKYNVNYYFQQRKRYGEKTTRNVTTRNGKRKALKIEQYTKSGELIKQWDNSREIRVQTGMSDWSISECCRGKRKTAYGYIWQYANGIDGRETI